MPMRRPAAAIDPVSLMPCSKSALPGPSNVSGATVIRNLMACFFFKLDAPFVSLRGCRCPRAAAIEEVDMARSSDIFGLPQFFARLLELWRLCRRILTLAFSRAVKMTRDRWDCRDAPPLPLGNGMSHPGPFATGRRARQRRLAVRAD